MQHAGGAGDRQGRWARTWPTTRTTGSAWWPPPVAPTSVSRSPPAPSPPWRAVGTWGYSGDGGPAPAAELAYPAGVALDDSGNLVICDSGNAAIRVVAATDGTFYGVPMTAGDIYTVAGSGTTGSAGNGGRALQAELDQPDGLAVDGHGNLVVADLGNNQIRVLAAHDGVFYGRSMVAGDIYGVVGTGRAGFAGDGAPAARAELDRPAGVAVDGRGDLIVADTGNSRVRIVAARSGAVLGRTRAGRATSTRSWAPARPVSVATVDPPARASLDHPGAVAVEGNGDLVVADTGNHRVRVVASHTGLAFGRHLAAGIDRDGGRHRTPRRVLGRRASGARRAPQPAHRGGREPFGRRGRGRPEQQPGPPRPGVGPDTPSGSRWSPATSPPWPARESPVQRRRGRSRHARRNSTLPRAWPSTPTATWSSPSSPATASSWWLPPAASSTAARWSPVTSTCWPGPAPSEAPATVDPRPPPSSTPPRAWRSTPPGTSTSPSSTAIVSGSSPAATGTSLRPAGGGRPHLHGGRHRDPRASGGDGGPATSASIDQPLGVAVDAHGNLVVGDYLGQRVRVVAASTGLVLRVPDDGRRHVHRRG